MRRLSEWIKPNSSKNLQTFYYKFSSYGAMVPKKIKELAERIVVESGEKEIFANTFNACKVLEEVILPEGLERISAFAFAHCDRLHTINLPNSISYIASSAFNDCGNLTIHCEQGSYADSFAKDNNIPVVYYNTSFAEDFEVYNNLWTR